MKNVTITLDAKTAAWARVQAANRNMSLSRFVGELLQEKMHDSREYEAAMRRFFAVKPMNLNDGKPLPKREELYDRKVLR